MLMLNLIRCGVAITEQCGYHETAPAQITPSGRPFRSYAIPTKYAGYVTYPSTLGDDPVPFDDSKRREKA